MIDRREGADGALSFSVIHATPSRAVTPRIPDVGVSYSHANSRHGFCTRSAHQSRWSLVMQRTHSHYTVRGAFAPRHNVDADGETTIVERRLRRLKGFVLCAVVIASYGGAWLIEALTRSMRHAFTVPAIQGRSL